MFEYMTAQEAAELGDIGVCNGYAKKTVLRVS